MDGPGLPPDEPDPGVPDDELRMRAISSVMQKMQDDEQNFFINRFPGDTLSTHSKLSAQQPGTPRTSRPCTLHDNVNRTVLSSAVILNNKNSAISGSYTSPRQYTLSEHRRHRSAGGIFDNIRTPLPVVSEPRPRAVSFDFDDKEGSYALLLHVSI